MGVPFWGGVHPLGQKELSNRSPLTSLAAPSQVAIPLQQHIGAPCTPLVAVGDTVTVGQKIGDGDGLCAPVHSSVSGTVIAIEDRKNSSGLVRPTVIIENDGKDTFASSLIPHDSLEGLSADDLVAIIREAGIVGMGGATFPTDVKANIGKVDTLIANACECEPYITADDVLLCTDAAAAVRGLMVLRAILQPQRTVIAIEDNKSAAIEVLKKTLKEFPEVELKVLPTRYPQGAEKQLIQAVTGRQVPSGGLPRDVGCNVFNIGTCRSVAGAVYEGRPFTHRIVTVTGGVKEPQNFMVPIGTSFDYVIEAAGGLTEHVWRVLAGGPMMGKAQEELSVPVTKGVNAIVVLTDKENREIENPSCIRCGRCVQVCPMGLQPLYLYRFSRQQDTDTLRHYKLMDCIECGCCAYTCPGKLPIVGAIREGKALLRKEGK